MTNITGGWSEYSCEIDNEAKNVFEKAVTVLGVSYQPVAVAKQVVAGLNYSFFCNAKVR